MAVTAQNKTKTNIRSNTKKKIKRKIPRGCVYIQATFNNTIITVTDEAGNVLAKSSSGSCGFRGSRKSTPYAAQSAADKVATQVVEDFNMEFVKIFVCGPGPGREAFRPFGNRLKVLLITDITGVPHNGCRGSKEPRK